MPGTHNAPPRVLVVAHTTTFLTELSLFGALIRARTDAEVVFHCAFVHWTADEFARACAAEGVACLLERSPAQVGGRSLLSRAIRRALALPGVIPGFLAESRDFAARAERIKALLAEFGPRLLVLGGDMPGYDTAMYVKVAHAFGIPVLVLPSTMSNGLEQAEVYYDHADHHVTGIARRLVAARFPHWVRRHKGRRLFRSPPGRILAMERAGIAPPLPWVFNSGHADAIAMESEAMIDYYAEAGMKNERMVLTGALSDDVMAGRLGRADELRAQLCGRLGLDPGKPLVLCALPPDFLYVKGGRPQCDFQDYRELAAFWIESLAALKDCNCLIALHPSVNASEMRWIERDNVRIAPGRTADFVPLCDVYVASISSTIRWAIACGKPVLNYDVYRYRYTDFLGVPGVLATEEANEFRSLLAKLAADTTYRVELAYLQQGVASRWGLLDGRVGDRVLALVTRLSGIPAGTVAMNRTQGELP